MSFIYTAAMTAPPVQRRGTKSAEARRADILDAAARLFFNAGYDGTTVQHIATAAGVAAGTMYLYYQSKEHVLLALHADFHAAMQAALEATFEEVYARVERDDLDNDAALELMVGEMVDTVVAFVRQDPTRTAVICQYVPRVHSGIEEAHDHSAQYLAAAIELGIAEGRVHVSDPQMAALLLEAAISGPLSSMIVSGNTAEMDRLAAQVKEFFIKALAPRS
jgi:AcrR family transcriptional regulator